MIITSIDWPSGAVYYTVDISKMYGAIQTQPYLLTVGSISRAVGQGHGIENSNCKVTYNDLNGYFRSKLVLGADQYIKGRKQTVIDWNEVTGVSTTLFTGFISQMDFITGGVLALNSDILTSVFDAEVANETLNVSEYPSLPANNVGVKKAIILGDLVGYFEPTPMHGPAWEQAFSVVAYYTGANDKYYLCKGSIYTLYSAFGLASGVWGDHPSPPVIIDNNADGNCYLRYTGVVPDDGRLYCAMCQDPNYTYDSPAAMLAYLLTTYLGITLDGGTAATTKLLALGLCTAAGVTAHPPGTVGLNNYVFADSTTWRALFQRIMDMFDCILWLKPNGHIGIAVNDNASIVSKGSCDANSALNFTYKVDYSNLIRGVYRQYAYSDVGQYFRRFPRDTTASGPWTACGQYKYLDQRYMGYRYSSDVISSLISAERYTNRYIRPIERVSFDVPRDYWFGATQAIALDIGDYITINHAQYMLHPSVNRYIQITGITINSDGMTVRIDGIDTYVPTPMVNDDVNYVANGGNYMVNDDAIFDTNGGQYMVSSSSYYSTQ